MTKPAGDPAIVVGDDGVFTDAAGRVFLTIDGASFKWNIRSRTIRNGVATMKLEATHIATSGAKLYPAEKLDAVCKRIRARVFIDETLFADEKQQDQPEPLRTRLVSLFSAMLGELDRREDKAAAFRRDAEEQMTEMAKAVAELQARIDTLEAK